MVLKEFAPGASKIKTASFKRMIHYRPLNMIENCTPNVTKAWKDLKVRFVPTGLYPCKARDPCSILYKKTPEQSLIRRQIKTRKKYQDLKGIFFEAFKIVKKIPRNPLLFSN